MNGQENCVSDDWSGAENKEREKGKHPTGEYSTVPAE